MSSESSFTPFCFTAGVCAVLSCCSGVGRDGGGIDVSSGLSDGFWGLPLSTALDLPTLLVAVGALLSCGEKQAMIIWMVY